VNTGSHTEAIATGLIPAPTATPSPPPGCGSTTRADPGVPFYLRTGKRTAADSCSELSGPATLASTERLDLKASIDDR